VLYIPSHVLHEVVNLDSSTLALNVWFVDELTSKAKSIWMTKLPIKKHQDSTKEILYFLHILTDAWCQPVNLRNDPKQLSNCKRIGARNSKFGFLGTFMQSMYPILGSLVEIRMHDGSNDAMALFVDIVNLKRCFGEKWSIKAKNMTTCWLIHEPKRQKWHNAHLEIIGKLKRVENIGIAELYFVEYMESLLLFVSDGSASMMPIVATLARIWSFVTRKLKL